MLQRVRFSRVSIPIFSSIFFAFSKVMILLGWEMDQRQHHKNEKGAKDENIHQPTAVLFISAFLACCNYYVIAIKVSHQCSSTSKIKSKTPIPNLS